LWVMIAKTGRAGGIGKRAELVGRMPADTQPKAERLLAWLRPCQWFLGFGVCRHGRIECNT
jgi:hypothetical protein